MTPPSQSANVGTVRTAWNTTILLAIAGAVSRYTDIDLDVEDPLVVAAIGAALAVFYRASRLLADNYSWIGYLLFGTPRVPGYPPQPPAPAPKPDDPDPPFPPPE